MMNLAKVLWLGACLAVLALFLLHENAWQNSELSTLCYLRTLTLTFPFGYVGGISIGYLFSLFDMSAEKVEFFVTWFSMVAVGYLQWFVLLPAVSRQVQRALKLSQKEVGVTTLLALTWGLFLALPYLSDRFWLSEISYVIGVPSALGIVFSISLLAKEPRHFLILFSVPFATGILVASWAAAGSTPEEGGFVWLQSMAPLLFYYFGIAVSTAIGYAISWLTQKNS